MTELRLPTAPEDLSLDVLNAVIGRQTPDASLAGFEIAEAHQWGGGQASSAGRIVIVPHYAASANGALPRRLVLKVSRVSPEEPGRPLPIAGAGGALYANEVAVYTRLKPFTFLEAPFCLGGAYDPASNAQLLILEDLRERGARFASVTMPTSLGRMQSLLDQLAILHARYWDDPHLTADQGWMESHGHGKIYEMFHAPEAAPQHIAHQVETVQFKREMVERLGTTADELFRRFQAVHRHQAGLPQTICHGDAHIGNTYVLDGDRAGLLDWQLTAQGFAIHDVSYAIATGLSVEQRRKEERDLIAFYRDRLLAHGLDDAPAVETLLREYALAMVWGVYIGWLTTPVVNYGWEVSVINHLRVMTAYEDLETSRLVDALG